MARLWWLALDAGACAALLALAHYQVRRVPSLIMRPLRRGVYLLVGAGGLFAALEIGQVIQIPPTVIFVGTLIVPVVITSLFSASIAGLIAPLAPGILTLRYRRYKIGDRIRITTPGGGVIAEGRVTNIDLYATDLATGDGEPAIPNAIIQASVVTVLNDPKLAS